MIHICIKNDALVLAEKPQTVAKGRLAEVEAQWKERKVNPSERLSAVTEFEAAGIDITNTHFMQQVGIATLLNVLGKNYIR